jgi:hypothetical protein
MFAAGGGWLLFRMYYGREFCGIQERHPYELLLAMEDIEHRTTKIRSPRTNGFVERMNRTLLDECFRVQGRQTWYIGVDEIQRDLDRFLRYYNSSSYCLTSLCV